jgi:hypothetical protein
MYIGGVYIICTFVADATFVDPLAEGALIVAAPVDVCGIKRGTAQITDCIEQIKARWDGFRIDHHAALDQARDRVGDSGNLPVLHDVVPSSLNLNG